MKVVLFCGGLGLRLRDHSEYTLKPMVQIGYRPILWHVMNYYAHFGHKDFILCLGYRGDVIKEYFLEYNECISNDFVLSNGGRNVSLLKSDIHDWNITFVDTGLHSNIGQRLSAVRRHVEGETIFLANYSDGLTDLYLPAMIDQAVACDKIASFLCVRPRQSFHFVTVGDDSLVTSVRASERADLWINGGYFILKQTIFDYIDYGEELVEEPFSRLMEAQQLLAHKYEGFWAALDTFKDKQHLEDLHTRGDAPWEFRPREADRTQSGAHARLKFSRGA